MSAEMVSIDSPASSLARTTIAMRMTKSAVSFGFSIGLFSYRGLSFGVSFPRRSLGGCLSRHAAQRVDVGHQVAAVVSNAVADLDALDRAVVGEPPKLAVCTAEKRRRLFPVQDRIALVDEFCRCHILPAFH